MGDLIHILRYKLLIFLKINTDWRAESLIKTLASGLVYAGFALGAYFFTRLTLTFLIDQAHIGLFLLHRFFSMLLFVFFLSITAGNIIVSYATLYRSHETTYLMTRPISYTTTFIIKFLENFFYSSTTLFFIGLAVLAGYGSYFQFSPGDYAVVLLFIMLPLMLIAALIGVMGLMGLLVLAVRIGVRPVIIGVAATYLLLVFSFFSLTNPTQLVNEVMQFYPDVDRYFGFLDPAFVRWLPSHWVSESLYWLVAGEPSRAIPHLLILNAISAASIFAAILIARRFFYPTWILSNALQVREKPGILRKSAISFGSNSRLDPQSESLLKKELWNFLREPSQWIHLAVILLLMGLFAGSIVQIEIIHANPFLQTVSYMVVFLFNAFLISSIALRFVYPLASLDAQAAWKTLSAPVGMSKIASWKFLPALGISILIAESLNALVHFPLTGSTDLLGFSSAVVFCSTVALISLNYGMGSYFATFTERNPIRIASSQGASLAFLLSLAFLVFLVAVLFFPLQSTFENLRSTGSVSSSRLLPPLILILIGSTAVVGISYFLVRQSWRRDF